MDSLSAGTKASIILLPAMTDLHQLAPACLPCGLLAFDLCLVLLQYTFRTRPGVTHADGSVSYGEYSAESTYVTQGQAPTAGPANPAPDAANAGERARELV